MDLMYRIYQQQDYNELKNMILSLYEDDSDGELMNEDKIMATINKLTIHSDKGKIVVFEKDECIVGYAILIYYWSNEYGGDILYVDELYVKPKWRNQGISTFFLKEFCINTKAGIVVTRIETTPSNKRVLEYYKTLDFRKDENIRLIKSNFFG